MYFKVILAYFKIYMHDQHRHGVGDAAAPSLQLHAAGAVIEPVTLPAAIICTEPMSS